ncbi:uncharacterized protein YecE (DUF72 family) [Granulicella aggregans]|uniref:Uncharacterized protein YecE (DUF72 family) n=1 Tax=Granulicella aggregans TaxID=474949 RepID=A0A7W7ZC41_9BACT|nr:DUF72 domain-containing protein [Granulicella aggregans]MBB5057013.1 uncharacterized protein YecE (DUF72 family) [Granulicella aggregans]
MPRASKTPETKINEKPVVTIVAPAGLFVGTSGWAYPTWKPGFYPEGLAAKKFLSYYACQVNSVEVNYTFRALPTAKMLSDWLAATPEGFRFSFKAPQRITHFKRLRECEADLSQFITALEPVGAAGKLGLLLFQLPPNFKADPERLRGFLAVTALTDAAIPTAFEFRHESWFTPEVEAVLHDHNAALCIAESDDLVSPEIHPSATHTSFRLRRNGGYSAAEIATFAEKFAGLAASRDVYVYFKHEDEPTGALNAAALIKTLGAGS